MKQAYYWDGERVSGLDRRSHQPQYTFKLKSHPEQDPVSLQFCEVQRGEETVEEKSEAGRG